ncbi:MAG TPA: serine hydrolase domain-containing protein, partial [Bacteroidales bacterium]|nr:serine hydrolase domain-containing protein [Bacteroidales bacterium]
MKNLFFSLSFLFLIAFNVFGQEAVFVRDSLDSYVNQAMKVWKIPGVAVAVVKNGKIILAKGYGLQRMDKPDKVDENTLFMIGSNTKAFTGTLMALFADEK